MWEYAILLVLWLVIAPLLGVIAYFRKDHARAAENISNLQDKLRQLTLRVAELESPGAAATTAREAVPPRDDVEPDAIEQSPHAAANHSAEEEAQPQAALSSAPAAAQKTSTRSEAMFASRWLVWLGGIAIAIGGAFLVSLSVEAGWLGPAQRIGAAILLGILSIAAGEYTRHRPLARVAAALNANTIPAALTAAGIAITFAAIYGGYALYGFFGALPTFAMLSLTALVAVALALLHDRYGSFIAALGLLGAYAVPLLVQTGSPDAAGLFLYVGLINVAALSLLRWRGWMWLGWGVFVGAIAWPILFEANAAIGVLEIRVLGIYAVASSGIAALILSLGRSFPNILLADPKTYPSITKASGIWISILGTVAAAALLVMLALAPEFTNTAILNVVWGAIIFTTLAALVRPLFPIALVSIAMMGAVIILWPLGNQIGIELSPKLFSRNVVGDVEMFPAATLPLLQVTAAAMLGIFLTGMAKLWHERPGYWGAIAALAPLLLFVLAYVRLAAYPHSFSWSYAALALTVGFEIAAYLIWRVRDRGALDHALAAMLFGVTASLSLFIALTLEQAWMTVALSLQVPVLAYIHRRLNVPVLRLIAGLIATLVIIRLLFNADVTNYALPVDGSLLNWIWYGYGVPALAFVFGARWFEDKARNFHAVGLMKAAAVGLAVVMVTLEVRVLASDGVWNPNTYSLLESALDVIAWSAIGLALYAFVKSPSAVIKIARGALVRYAAIHAVVVHLILFNPLWSRIEVSQLPLFNVLGLAYLAPALIAAFVTLVSLTRAAKDRFVPVKLSSGIAALMAFAYVNFEIRAMFHDGVLGGWGVTQPELYTYSGAWFLMAAALLTAGIAWQGRQLRFAGLAMLALVVAKVFLIDMSQLEGIFRVLSFIGLGAGLVVIGYAYQRFVLPAASDESEVDLSH